jgi:methanogen homocitrate synthase
VVACKLLLGLDVNIDIKRLVELSKLVEEMTGFKLAKNKPIVGESNFTRESGIGADALLTAPLAMFAMNPRFLGRQPELVLGKKSGMTSIEMKLKRYNIELDEEAKKALLSDVKSLGIQKKGVLTDEEFLALTKRYSK